MKIFVQNKIMILELIISLSIALLLLIVVSVLIKFYEQHKFNDYFKKLSPNLPVPYELLSIYGGHCRTVSLNKRNCFVIDGLHKKYGKTFGIYYTTNTPSIVTTDLDLIKALILDDLYRNINRAKVNVPIEEVDIDSIATCDDPQWRRIRQAAAPAFTNHKVKTPNALDEIASSIDKLVKSIEKKIDGSDDDNKVTLDSDDMSLRYSADVVFRCFFKQDDLINFDSKTDYWTELITNGLRDINYPVWHLCVVFQILAPFLIALVDTFFSQGRMRRSLQKFIRKQTKANFDARNELKGAKLEAEKNNLKFDPDNFTLKDGTKFKRNLIDYFTDQFHDGKLSEREYFNNAGFIFYAANKTTSDAISLLLYQLANHPDIQDKLRESILKEGEESEYLMWCLNESLRLYPPVPAGCSRKITHNYTTKDGIFIPEGCFILTSTYTIHRSTEYWGEDALEYKPERWSKSKDFHPCQFLAFGLGSRNCIGKAFALQEIKMLMNVLLRKFKFERSPLSTDNNLFESPAFIFTNYDKPHFVRISRI